MVFSHLLGTGILEGYLETDRRLPGRLGGKAGGISGQP